MLKQLRQLIKPLLKLHVRVVQFFNEEDNIEYRLATNVQNTSEKEIKEVYCLRRQIEDALEIGEHNHKE